MSNFFCNEIADGECIGCGACQIEDCANTHPGTGEAVYDDDNDDCEEYDGQPSWEQEWEDFGEGGCESIEYM